MPIGSGSDNFSRGAGKLAGFLRFAKVDFRGKVVLDIGSSTGGFTEVALKKGAAKVIAVEKGTGQMRKALVRNPKVELHEKTDIFDVVVAEKPDIILIDVSFLSLTKVLEYARMELACGDTDVLGMFKPQFEAKKNQLNNGVVKNERMRREIMRVFEVWLKNYGYVVKAKRDNEVTGRYGNRERFYWLRLAATK